MVRGTVIKQWNFVFMGFHRRRARYALRVKNYLACTRNPAEQAPAERNRVVDFWRAPPFW